METRLPEDSGVFDQLDGTDAVRVQPETVIVSVAWILSIVQIGFGLARSGGFGADRGVAIAFAIGCPQLLREQLLVIARRAMGFVRGPSGTSQS